jgi:lipoprotein-releasing system permease protein
LEIDLKDIADVKRLTPIIEETVGFPYYALNVFELHSSMFAWIDLQKAPIPIVLGLISIVAVFNIITILLVTIVEKTRSIGILRSLGMKNRGILALFVTQGVAIGTAGAVTGCLLGFLFGFTQNAFKIISLNSDIYFLDALPVDMSAWHFVLVLSASIFCSFLAALVPSLIAVRISPVKSLRFR